MPVRRPSSLLPIPARALVATLAVLAFADAHAQVVEYALPTADARPQSIVAGPDGNVWFVEQPSANGDLPQGKIGKITPNGEITEYLPPNTTCVVRGLVSGAQNNLWFTETGCYMPNSPQLTSKIGKISVDGSITEYPAHGEPADITLGSDGNIWFTYSSWNELGRITPNGVTTDFPLAGNATNAQGITRGPDGNLWYAEPLAIGRMTPSGVASEFGPALGAGYIAAGPDGNLWYTVPFVFGFGPNPPGDTVARITPQGVITEFITPTTQSVPFGITGAPDGNVWFTESRANAVARITPTGHITEFPLPTPDSGPFSITAGPDGNIWFTESPANKIGKISLSALPGLIGGFMSGNWYDPSQAGQGFQLEFVQNQIAIAVWYTFTPDGSGQNWIYAQGSYDETSNTVTLPAELLSGARFVPLFNPNDVVATSWGSLTFTFSDCNHGVASWASPLPGYGSGSMPIVRLTQVSGTSCP
ncbi:MAG TPA: hypothetical protein VLS52_07295 [Rudaea sp.]|nr:hypothetical protein [Rudaea sp.]